MLDEAGEVLAQRSRACAVLPGPPYPQLDLDGIWRWAVAALRELAAMAQIRCIVPVAHGAAAVLMGGEAPVLPALDYEHPAPDACAGELAALLDPFALTGSPILPLGMCLGAQLHWQERSFPDAFARASDLLLLPQYWAWRLSGVRATEVTSLGAHTHLWRPAEGAFSGLVERRGWARLFSPMRRAWETLGPVKPEVAAATGLPRDCRVVAGIHDSNASYLPHLVARAGPFTVLSTGTWVIAMAAGAGIDRLDPAADMLANVDARGQPVPTARFMGGREVELVAGADALQAAAGPTTSRRSWPPARWRCRASSPAAGRSSAGRGGSSATRVPSPPGAPPCASLYAALIVDTMLDKLGSAGPVIVEGSFHRNAAFCGLLAALRPGQAIHATDDPSGTARGAWFLARWDERPNWPNALAEPVTRWPVTGLAAYRTCWLHLTRGANPA